MHRSTLLILLAISTLLIATGCVTSSSIEMPRTETFGQENDDLSAKLLVTSNQWVELRVINKTEQVLVLDPNLASFSRGEKSYRLIPEGTKYIDATRSQPPIALAPRGTLTKPFSSADSSEYVREVGWVSRDWLPYDLSNSSFVFGYKLRGKESFIIFKGNENQNRAQIPDPALGTVTAKSQFWNLLFLRSRSSRREALLTLALEEAQKKYGDDVELRNPRYVGRWSPLSLLLYVDMLGFVENASVEAEVVKKK